MCISLMVVTLKIIEYEIVDNNSTKKLIADASEFTDINICIKIKN